MISVNRRKFVPVARVRSDSRAVVAAEAATPGRMSGRILGRIRITELDTIRPSLPRVHLRGLNRESQLGRGLAEEENSPDVLGVAVVTHAQGPGVLQDAGAGVDHLCA